MNQSEHWTEYKVQSTNTTFLFCYFLPTSFLTERGIFHSPHGFIMWQNCHTFSPRIWIEMIASRGISLIPDTSSKDPLYSFNTPGKQTRFVVAVCYKEKLGKMHLKTFVIQLTLDRKFSRAFYSLLMWLFGWFGLKQVGKIKHFSNF